MRISKNNSRYYFNSDENCYRSGQLVRYRGYCYNDHNIRIYVIFPPCLFLYNILYYIDTSYSRYFCPNYSREFAFSFYVLTQFTR